MTETELVWKGSSWELRLHRLLLPNGETVVKGVIQHPDSVLLLPMIGDQVLMLQQYRLAIDRLIWELPAGTSLPNEDWLSCAQRELREETGYRAGTFTHLGNFWLAPGSSSERMIVFLATDLQPDPLPSDPDENISCHLLPLPEVQQMVFDGRLEDAKSIAGIFHLLHYLSQSPSFLST